MTRLRSELSMAEKKICDDYDRVVLERMVRRMVRALKCMVEIGHIIILVMEGFLEDNSVSHEMCQTPKIFYLDRCSF